MSHINIRRKHDLSHQEARGAAERIARQLNQKFQLDYYWEDDTLYFERSGVNGQMKVTPAEVWIYARLGFLLSALKPKLEREIHRHLNEMLTQA